MIDAGCESGRISKLFSSDFQKIVGVDVNAEQIKQAQENCQIKNISFEVGSAESLPAANNSVDLITSGQAAHYFDLPNFFAEVRRVLKPSGCMALLGYSLSKINPVEVDTTNLPENIDEISVNLFHDLLQHGMPENIVENNPILEVSSLYENIFNATPFEVKVRHDNIDQEKLYSFDELQKLIKSVSIFETPQRLKLQN